MYGPPGGPVRTSTSQREPRTPGRTLGQAQEFEMSKTVPQDHPTFVATASTGHSQRDTRQMQEQELAAVQ